LLIRHLRLAAASREALTEPLQAAEIPVHTDSSRIRVTGIVPRWRER
jgi:hypothetical protein